MSQPPTERFDVRGAVDLSGLGRPPAPAPETSADADGVPVVDVTEESFAGLVQQSTQVPVVVELLSARTEQSAELDAVLRRVVGKLDGQVLLARIDVDANPQLAAAFQVQAVPSVLAIIGGQPVPLFEGSYPEEQVTQVLDQVLALARQNGVTGRVDVPPRPEDGEPAEPEEPPLPPLHQAAYDAIERDDLEGAVEAYTQALQEDPRDAMAEAGLAQVRLMQRTRDLDPQAVRTAAEQEDDVAAQLDAADLEVMSGDTQAAFDRLIAVVRRTRDEDRDRVRLRLVELFEVVGGQDERVIAARRALTNALY